jgi:hypothetical protein
MTKQAKFDPIGKARAQSRLLELIPEPTDEAFRHAARAALVHAGVGAETMAILEEASQRARYPKSG